MEESWSSIWFARSIRPVDNPIVALIHAKARRREEILGGGTCLSASRSARGRQTANLCFYFFASSRLRVHLTYDVAPVQMRPSSSRMMTITTMRPMPPDGA